MKFKIKYKLFRKDSLIYLEEDIRIFCEQQGDNIFIENVDIKHEVDVTYSTVNETKYYYSYYAVVRYSEITKDGEVNENDK